MDENRITLDHGSGGKVSHELVSQILLPYFQNPILSKLDDGASFTLNGARLAFSTDTYVVDPPFFPGGNIGDLAVNGTVNDIAMCGGVPRFISVGLILEEGLPLSDLSTILKAMQVAAKTADVQIVTGDTKVVPRGSADRIFINTSGIGEVPDHVHLGSDLAQPGDRVILSGTMADHGITILNQREQLSFDAATVSDTAALNKLVEKILNTCPDTRVLRDPTRGGVATALNEIALQSKIGIEIDETSLPVRDDVAGMCELLGLDPLYVANEGKLLAFVPTEDADAILSVMRQDPLGERACIIAKVVAEPVGVVTMQTAIGGKRIVTMLAGEQFPRIC